MQRGLTPLHFCFLTLRFQSFFRRAGILIPNFATLFKIEPVKANIINNSAICAAIKRVKERISSVVTNSIIEPKTYGRTAFFIKPATLARRNSFVLTAAVMPKATSIAMSVKIICIIGGKLEKKREVIIFFFFNFFRFRPFSVRKPKREFNAL